jgi:hypothetical protein
LFVLILILILIMLIIIFLIVIFILILLIFPKPSRRRVAVVEAGLEPASPGWLQLGASRAGDDPSHPVGVAPATSIGPNRRSASWSYCARHRSEPSGKQTSWWTQTTNSCSAPSSAVFNPTAALVQFLTTDFAAKARVETRRSEQIALNQLGIGHTGHVADADAGKFASPEEVEAFFRMNREQL